MNKRKLFYPLLSLLPLLSQAQEGTYRYDDATQLWRQTQNAAGLSLDSTANRGYAEFNFQHAEGDYRRVQEGDQSNQLQFITERYQAIGDYLVGYGRFQFDMDRTKHRSWCDVMRPYLSDPFFPGSSISGKYDTQQFDFSAALGTVSFSGFRFGARLDYQAGDLSRLRDPRSRSQLLQYRITPAITYTADRHTIGLNGHYDRRKEKIPNITTVQQDPNLVYYQMTGMEQASGITGGYSGFNREWVNHQLGAELNYNYRDQRLNSLTTASIARGVENIWGTYKYEPGRYTTYLYGVSSHNRINDGCVLHELDLDMNFTQGYADEYRQQLLQERDPEKGYTTYRYETLLEYKKRYQLHHTNAQMHYRANFVDQQQVKSYLGVTFHLTDANIRHLLPKSEMHYDFYDFTGELGHSLFSDRLWIDAEGGYHLSRNAELLLAEATNYSQQVLVPDMRYYGADYWHASLALTCQLPLKVKGNIAMTYVKVHANYLRTVTAEKLDRLNLGVSLGLYY